MMKNLPDKRESKNEAKKETESAVFSVALERVQNYEFQVQVTTAIKPIG